MNWPSLHDQSWNLDPSTQWIVAHVRTSSDLCRLLITCANSLDPDQDRLKKKVYFEKLPSRQSVKNALNHTQTCTQLCREPCRQTHSQTDRQTDRHTDRHIHTYAENSTGRHTGGQTHPHLCREPCRQTRRLVLCLSVLRKKSKVCCPI